MRQKAHTRPLFSNEPKHLPAYVVFRDVVRTSKAYMKCVTAIAPEWIAHAAKGTPLCSLSAPLDVPAPTFDAEQDVLVCHVRPTFGAHKWELPPHRVPFPHGEHSEQHYRWFARLLLEGKVVSSLGRIAAHLCAKPGTITREVPSKRVATLLQALQGVPQLGKLVAVAREEPAEHHRLGLSVTW